MTKPLLLLACLLSFLSGCAGGSSHSTATSDSITVDSADFAHEVHFDYAEGIHVTNHPTHKEVLITAPGSSDTLAYYILYPRDHKPQLTASGRAYFIPVPARTMGALSTTEVGALPLLRLRQALIACATPSNISDSVLAERVRRGEIAEIAQGMGRDVERIIALHPEVLIQGVQPTDDRDDDLRKAGIAVVSFNNWQESTVLGRAEWMKFIGLLFGRNAQAEEAFRHIEQEYQAAQALIPATEEPQHVLYGLDYKGVWYIPGARTYVTQLLRDAYLRYDSVPGTQSRPVSFEYVFSRHREASTWLCPMAGDVKSLRDFLALNERYRLFSATQSGRVWSDRKRTNAAGGNDIWESGLYCPHLLLKDLIKITRPELLPDYETTYWTKLN